MVGLPGTRGQLLLQWVGHDLIEGYARLEDRAPQNLPTVHRTTADDNAHLSTLVEPPTGAVGWSSSTSSIDRQ